MLRNYKTSVNSILKEAVNQLVERFGLLVFFISVGFPMMAQTINTPTSPSLPLTICAGTNISVAFTTSGSFNPGNQFQVQLSNATGSFLSGTVIIGTGSSSPISCLVRIGTAAGTQYRIRVLSTSPSVIGSGSPAGTPITVRSKPSSPSTTGGSRCGTGTVNLSSSGCSTTRWYSASEGGSLLGTGAAFTTPSISSTTSYFACCVDVNGCESVRTSTTATVNPAPAITSFSPSSGTIDVDNIVISGTNLSGVTNVQFNGTSSTSITDNSSTSVTALVPVGATSGPISVTTGCGTVSSGSSFTVIRPTIANPTASQASGTYTNGFFTTLSTTTDGAQIYYTTNGNTPVVGTAFTRLYEDEPIFIPQSLTLRAIGFRNGWTTSGVSTFNYTVTNPNIVARPVITPPSGSYSGGQLVTITCATPGSTIFFTTNGQNPVPFVNTPVRYRGPFSVIDPQVTVRAIGTLTDWADSEIAAAFYTISGGSALSACSFNPPPGSYGSPISVTISNPDPSAQIFFTWDGTDPYKLLPLARPYAGPVAIPFSLTLKAQAFRDGFGDSPRTVGNYSITGGGRMAVDQPADPKGLYYTEATGIYGGDPEPAQNRLQDLEARTLTIYPNPGNGTFYIDFGTEVDHAEVLVFNTMGKLVKRGKTDPNVVGAAFSLEGQQPGVYLVRIKEENGRISDRRVVLQ
jgi:hypothetical protein